jgi:hypothetical protein
MLRAQTSAASLSAALEVLSRFVAMALQPGQRSPLEEQITHLMSTAGVGLAAEPVRPQPSVPTPMAQAPVHAALQAPARGEPVAPPQPLPEPEPLIELGAEPEAIELIETVAPSVAAEPELEGDFDVNQLSPEEQELHRRANRVAKVSMQDIKMLRPDQVRLGREKKTFVFD